MSIASRPRPLARLAALAAGLIGAATPVIAAQVRQMVFPGVRGRTQEARLIIPLPQHDNGHAVLLIGGGAAWDMHWTVPGEAAMTAGGQPKQITISGRPTRDGDRLAKALADAGFTVLQWSAIHMNDPAYPDDWGAIDGLTYPESIELTRTALRLLRSQPEVDADRVILIGHSLGATRAAQVADEGVVGMVFLAGAYLSRVREPPRGVAALAFEATPGLDANDDGLATPEEWSDWTAPLTGTPRARLAPSFDQMDRDDDGAVRHWEIASWSRLRRLAEGEAGVLDDRPEFREGLPWPGDVLARTPGRPVLALFGGLDILSLHGPLLEQHKALSGLEGLSVHYLPDLGHHLSPQRDGRLGPMPERVLDRVVGWLSDRFAAAATEQPGRADPDRAR